MRSRTTLYILKEILNEFKEICVREGESMSQKVEQFMEQYNQIHRVGNPQMMLERFGVDVKLICFRCGGKFSSLIKVEFISGLTAMECPDCVKMDRERGVIRREIGTV